MLRDSILATIFYYDSFNFPLTLAEVYKFLISPIRSSARARGTSLEEHGIATSYGISPNKFSSDKTEKVGAVELINELDRMVRVGIIGHKNGFYFMSGKERLYKERIEKDKISAKKWKKFLSIAKYLQLSPYLRAVFVSGSMAVNNSEPKSDFDVLVVIKNSRLYTGRLFLWLISSVLGARRGRFDTVAPDKLCFNHYVTDDGLSIFHRSLYIAQTAINLRPVIDYGSIADNFSSSNEWISSFCCNFEKIDGYREIKSDKTMLMFAKSLEIVLDTPFGDLFEKIIKSVQQKRIKRNPATYEPGGRTIFTDKELEFHPHSFEKVVIENYNKGLKKLGVIFEEEKDSGLTP